jgi:glutamate-1-semialdehyde 2,1-aminomutase
MVTIGKAVAGGLPMGAYGVSAELGEQLDAARNVATGGTLFGNPLSAAAA